MIRSIEVSSPTRKAATHGAQSIELCRHQIGPVSGQRSSGAKPKRYGHYAEYQTGCTPIATVVKCYWGMRQALAIK